MKNIRKTLIAVLVLFIGVAIYAQDYKYNPLIKKNLDLAGSSGLDSNTVVTDMKTDNTADYVIGYKNGKATQFETYSADSASFGGYYFFGNNDSLWIEKPKGNWIKKLYP